MLRRCFIFLLFLTLLSSCDDNETFGGNKRSVQAFGWLPGNDTIIAVISNLWENEDSTSILVFDNSGKLVQTSEFRREYFSSYAYSSTTSLSFLPDTKNIYYQQGDNIVCIDYGSAAITPLVTGRVLGSTSPSGLLFYFRDPLGLSNTYSLAKIDGTTANIIKTVTFFVPEDPISGPFFITDNIICATKYPKTVPGDSCLTVLSDTSGNTIAVLNDCISYFQHPSESPDLFFIGVTDSLYSYNINSKKISAVTYLPNITSLQLNSTGTKIYYCVSEKGSELREIHSRDLQTGIDQVLSKDSYTSIQLSDDDSFLAYFTYESKDIKPKILRVK